MGEIKSWIRFLTRDRAESGILSDLRHPRLSSKPAYLVEYLAAITPADELFTFTDSDNFASFPV